MEGMERFGEKKPVSEVARFYEAQESGPRAPEVVLGEAAQIEFELVHHEAAHDLSADEYARKLTRATAVITELESLIATPRNADEGEMAASLRASLETFVHKKEALH